VLLAPPLTINGSHVEELVEKPAAAIEAALAWMSQVSSIQASVSFPQQNWHSVAFFRIAMKHSRERLGL